MKLFADIMLLCSDIVVAKYNLILTEAQALTTNLHKNHEALSMNFNW